MPDLDIVARLKLSGEAFSAEFDQRMKRVEDSARAASSRINEAVSGVSAAARALVAGASIGAIAAASSRALDYAASLGEVSQQLGVTARDLQLYRYMASQVGIDQDAMERSLSKLTVTLGKAALGAKEPQRAFAALGIDVKDANGHVLTAGQAIPQIADALAKVSDPAQRAAVQVALFGKTGQQLDTLLSGGSQAITGMAEQAERLGLVLSSKQIQDADAAADKLAEVKQVLEVDIARVVANNASSIYSLAGAIETLAGKAAKSHAPLEGFWRILSREGAVGGIRSFLGDGADQTQAATAEGYFRLKQQQFRDARNSYVFAKNHGGSGPALEERAKAAWKSEADARKALQDWRDELAAVAAGPKGNNGLDNFLDTSTNKTEKLTKAQREAQDQARKNAAEIKALLAEGDPVGDASAKFQKSVALIQDQLAQGLITQDQADTAGRAAGQSYANALTQAISDEASAFQKTHPELSWLWDDNLSLKKFDTSGIERRVESSVPGLLQRPTPNADIRQVSEMLESSLGYRIGGAPSRLLSSLGGGANDNLSKGFKDAFSPLSEALDRVTGSLNRHLGDGGSFQRELGQLLGNASLGNLGGGIFESLGGGKDNKLASGLGGVLGGEAGKAIGPVISKAIGGTLGKTLGGFAGPLGSIAGGIAGDLVSKLLGGHTTGKSTISFSTTGGTAGAGFGTNASANAAAVGEANSIIQGVQGIAKSLGASINAFSGITVGTRDGDYRVNVSGSSLKTSKGAKNFGDDQAGAIAYAIQQSIARGVITGISKASINILKSGQDLQAAIQKATLIEQIPRDLKAMLDPVGAAIDDLNRKWRDTVDALKEGGASAEQLAEAERLHRLQLDQVKASTDAADASLKAFQLNLKLGSNSPYSLRDQEATAKAALQPFLDTIGGGGAIDQQKYQQAAQAFLDVERQIYGSTQQYFEALDAIQAATNKAIETIDNATPIGGTVADPFASSTASATQATATNTATGNQLLSQVSDQLTGIAQQLAAANNNRSAPGFIGATRGF